MKLDDILDEVRREQEKVPRFTQLAQDIETAPFQLAKVAKSSWI